VRTRWLPSLRDYESAGRRHRCAGQALAGRRDAESQRPATVVVAAAAGAVILTIAVGPRGHSAGMQLLLPVLAGAFVVVLRHWPLRAPYYPALADARRPGR
jgi:hypothetical protein